MKKKKKTKKITPSVLYCTQPDKETVCPDEKVYTCDFSKQGTRFNTGHSENTLGIDFVRCKLNNDPLFELNRILERV